MSVVHVAFAFLGGIALGLFFFGSLWWVVNQVQRWQRPELWLVVGFFVRTAVVLAGIYWVMGHNLEKLVACLVGFLLVRIVMVRLLRPQLSGATQTKG